ncbi:M81 family metallopeptidase [Streptomyces sp. NPDC047009]|uniref:M81 family metallopeptidase n=1 Tax=Streptomyces sp. NPDC047009 TaxID=3154496 RepID=UPI0033DE1163
MSGTGDRTGKRLRVGIGGVHIECSTFTPHSTGYDDFTIRRGAELLNLFDFTRPGREDWAEEVEWVPLVHARAVPGGSVDPATYARLEDELTNRLRQAGPLDGLVLDLHGAMHVAGRQDIEADLAAAVRSAVGPDCLIASPTDLHGSVTAALVAQLDLLTAHRLAPHEDEWLTRARAARLLVHCLRQGIRPSMAWVRVPVLLPGEKTSTQQQPARGIYGSLADIETLPGVLDAALWVGYAWADEPRSAAAVVLTGTDETVLRDQAHRLAERYWQARDEFTFVGPTGTAQQAVTAAVESTRRPFVISDSGDNPTAGGGGDTADLLTLLLADDRIAERELSTIHAGILDPHAVTRCTQAGVGGTVYLMVGGRLEGPTGLPARLTGRVDLLVDDPEGGPTAVVTARTVSVVLTSRRRPFHHIADFTRLGLDPHQSDIVIVKIGYLEPELHDLAHDWIIALTPGGVDQDLLRLGHHELARPLHPFDHDMPDPDLTPRIFPPRTAGERIGATL